MGLFSECTDAMDARPLRQGDILRHLSNAEDDWEYLSVIVTADCDIARNKHAGRLTRAPILPLPTYLSAFYMPKRLQRLRSAVADRMVALMREGQRGRYGDRETHRTSLVIWNLKL